MHRSCYRLILSLFLVLTLLVNLTGCIPNAPAQPARETVKVIDQLNREVEVVKNPQRIVSAYYISTTTLLSLGLKDKIVGLEIEADKRDIYRYVAPELIKAPAVGSAKSLNIEEVLKLKPDLVVIPARLKDIIPTLEQNKIAVLAIEPETLDSFLSSLLLLGKATGKEQRAQEIINYYNSKLAQIKTITSQRTKQEQVYMAGRSPLTTITTAMYQNAMISLSGGVSVSREITTGYWANVSLEQLLKWNPEIILIAPYAGFKMTEITDNPQWRGIKAVKNKQVFDFPSAIEAWDSPMPTSILGILWLTHTLNPELYPKAELEKEIVSFYKRNYGVEIPLADFKL